MLQVSAQQSEMDGKFTAMHRTVLLLKKYGQILPEKTQYLFSAAPGRWSNLKTKVSLAKQRLGPRIQEESASISVVRTPRVNKNKIKIINLEQCQDQSVATQAEAGTAHPGRIRQHFCGKNG
jgi:hypothetical protein